MTTNIYLPVGEDCWCDTCGVLPTGTPILRELDEDGDLLIQYCIECVLLNSDMYSYDVIQRAERLDLDKYNQRIKMHQQEIIAQAKLQLDKELQKN